ncbi:hypothetical protein IFM89_012396 [Coptis chinensis]|uniref:RNase H type-1 domain-containing protein n=1 Tax=Coptis chinensis TaxID=261450 RepID=A0A835IC66_9MAGN|nr:hypothetical protein IFM89_012396 [Coptis chinensis]
MMRENFNKLNDDIKLSQLSCTQKTNTQILSDWGIQGKLRTAPRIESVNWIAPNAPTIKVNTDGASKGNPGLAGIGSTFRVHNGDFLLTYCRAVVVTTSYWDECLAIIEAA